MVDGKKGRRSLRAFAHNLTGTFLGQFGIAEHEATVNEDVGDTFGVLMWIVEGAGISDFGWIKENNVGDEAGFEKAAV